MRKKLFFILISTLFIFGNIYGKTKFFTKTININRFSYLSLATDRTEGINYINNLRSEAGLNLLTENSLLDEAAMNHANYLILNNTFGHYESKENVGFTGETPYKRVLNVGYTGFKVLENISAGDKDITESINGLFSAIYHRLGFLDFDINEIGIGEKYSDSYTYKTVFVYDMGSTDTSVATNNPKYVIWPYDGATDVSPVFYEEIPDPLPNCSVSGYPISVEFNPEKIGNINLIDFELTDTATGEDVNSTILSQLTDPNKHFNQYQFALMPLERLKFNTQYNVKFVYSEDGLTKTITWNFKTKSLKYPYYIVDTQNATLKIKPANTYIIYLKPLNCNDKFSRFSASYFGSSPKIEFVDYNTLKVTSNASIGSEITINTSNSRNIILIVSNEDDTIYPSHNINAVPQQPQYPEKFKIGGIPPIKGPTETVIVNPVSNVSISPSMIVPSEVQGQQATLIMYIQIGSSWINIPQGNAITLGNMIKFLGLNGLNFSKLSGFSFNIWYGFLLPDKTLYYNVYKIEVK